MSDIMRDKRYHIQNALSKAEEFQDGVNTLVNALNVLREEGGKVKLSVYTKSGHGDCTSELTEKSADECLKVLIREYNDLIIGIKKEINEMMDSMIDCYVESPKEN